MPHLTCDRIERERPQLRHERFVAVRQAGQVMRVTAVCRRIGNAGITGQALGNVRAAMPGLVAVECGAEADREAQCLVADWARGFGPVVALYGDDAVMVEVGGSAHLFGGEDAMALAARRGLARLGFMGRVTVAGTPRAAHALALAGREGAWAACRFPEPVEGRQAETPAAPVPFDKLRDTGAVARSAPSSLPLSTLSLDGETLQALGAFGLRTVGDVLRLPREGLPSRLGGTLVRRLDELTGAAEEPLDLYVPEAGMCERVAFDTPIDDGQTLLFVVKRMVDRMAERLAGSGTGALSLRLSLRMESSGGGHSCPPTPNSESSRKSHIRPHQRRDAIGTPKAPCKVDRSVHPPSTLHLDVRAAEPMCDGRALMLLLSARLDALELDDSHRIEGMDLHVTGRGPLAARSRGLFDGKPRRDHGQLADLLARLTARIGSDGVSRAVLTEDRRPAKAWRAVPFLEGDELAEPRRVKAKRKAWRDYDGSGFDGSENDRSDPAMTGRDDSPAGNIIRGRFPPVEGGGGNAGGTHSTSSGQAPAPQELVDKSVHPPEVVGEGAHPPSIPRPLRLFAEPQACTVELGRGHPTRIIFGATSGMGGEFHGWDTGVVVATDGPERITSAWWEPEGGEARDLWRVELDDGRMVWLSRDLREGDWQVIGTWG